MSFALGFYSGGTSAPPPPPPPNLDSLTTGLFGCYGIARLLTAYSGHAMTVRRSSDNTTAAINFLSTGALDTVTLLAFAGSGDAFIATLNDHSGAGNDFAMATNGAQPKIVSAGTYLGYIDWDGTDDCLIGTTNNGAPSAVSLYLGGTLRGTATRQVLIESNNGSPASGSANAAVFMDYANSVSAYRNILGSDNYNNLLIGAVTGVALSTSVHTAVADFTKTTQATMCLYYVDATAHTPSYSPAGTLSTSAVLDSKPWHLGARNGGSSLPAQLNLYVLAIYNVNHGSTTVAAVETVLHNYV